ncbi:MAG: hypothetical protein IJY94_00135 [Clostridia bacterium]|nr:hypothetical protein [Clostridia bacterium]
MKAFIFSLSIILAITALTVVSGLYVKNVTDRLLELEKQFPLKEDGESSPSSVITESEELFSSSYNLLTAISHTRLPNNVKTSLEHLVSCYRHGTYADYMAARESYVEALRSLRQAELPSFRGII